MVSITALSEIHAAPSIAWPALVARLLAEAWTVKQTQAAVVKEISVPADKLRWCGTAPLLTGRVLDEQTNASLRCRLLTLPEGGEGGKLSDTSTTC